MNLLIERFNEALAADGPDRVAIYNSGQLLLDSGQYAPQHNLIVQLVYGATTTREFVERTL